MRLIDKDDLLEWLVAVNYNSDMQDEWHEGLLVAINAVKKAVNIDPVKHGRWKDNKWYYECDQCGGLVANNYNYCPNCGARMDGDENEID